MAYATAYLDVRLMRGTMVSQMEYFGDYIFPDWIVDEWYFSMRTDGLTYAFYAGF